ncbi:hypothetical protein B6V73_01720 [Thioclava sp. JM3]|uniref:CsgG/HfaB family protein n=1 Tax=unclassified Thioclava TaxID=2621713 RepID=UPI000B53E21F|nr:MULTISPECIES: CsgG/HfaB family protein [unclassified Thioclava]OWY04929.1 hypothetical protein B6V75_01960 [Thioclava sp. F1Mire-8]OWY18541.1 hypothetical protein B6V73_01720 [Thioclava sp. JM3]PWE50545.1 curli production assembly protein CsgG [Thioclava sp. NG1]
MKSVLRLAFAVVAGFTLSGCGANFPHQSDMMFAEKPVLQENSSTKISLDYLPPPARPIDVAVYDFPDLTGQNKPNSDFADFSRAVTQGGADILTDVLTSVGNGKWFNVVERNNVDDLLKERSIIEQTQKAYGGKAALPPLRFAGIIMEGSIVGYDSSVQTGGFGARFLGIGGTHEYRKNVVTVALRAVSVSTGRVLTSVTTTKTIYSVQLQGDVFRFVATDKILELETGVTRNEPKTFAVRRAMELAVYSLIVKGAETGQWSFASQSAGKKVIQDYNAQYKLVKTVPVATIKVASSQP